MLNIEKILRFVNAGEATIFNLMAKILTSSISNWQVRYVCDFDYFQ